MAYSPVYSAQFINYTDSSPNTLFDVPSGYTAVVRDIGFWCGGGESLIVVYFGNSPLAPEVTIAGTTQFGVNTLYHWSGRCVVPGGGVIGLYQQTLGVGATAYVHGYLLANTIP